MRSSPFALYTHDHGVLKLTSQFFPLKPGEARQARLEFQREGVWAEVAAEPILYPGWSRAFSHRELGRHSERPLPRAAWGQGAV